MVGWPVLFETEIFELEIYAVFGNYPDSSSLVASNFCTVFIVQRVIKILGYICNTRHNSIWIQVNYKLLTFSSILMHECTNIRRENETQMNQRVQGRKTLGIQTLLRR